MKKIILFIIIVVMFSLTTVFAGDCIIECTTEITEQNVCISGRITNVTESHQVTLLVGETDNILYIDQVATTDDGLFIFDFSLPDTLNSGSYNFRIGSDSSAENYQGVLQYTTNSRITCDVNVEGQNINISGQILNAESVNQVTLLVGETDNILYIDQVATTDDGLFIFDFSLPDTLNSGSYNFRIGSDSSAESYEGVLQYTTNSRIACQVSIQDGNISISGRIVNVESVNQVTLVVGDADNILYIDQKATAEDGSFNFTFGLLDEVNSGSYNFRIGSSAGVGTYEGVLEYRKDSRIVCNSAINGRDVNISGSILNASSTNNVNLLVGDVNNVIYTEQTTSTEDGNFNFDFELPVTLPSGTYNFTVDTDAEVPSYNGVLIYESTVEVIESQFFDGNIIVSVSNYIPTIVGNVSCVDGKEINFNVINSSDNTVIAQDIVTSEDGIYNLNYVLPSLITGKDYAVTISCENETQTLFSMDVEINSSVILVEVSGDIQVADDVKLETNVQTTNSNLINKSATITTNRSISTTIPNLVANMSCYVTLRGYESVIVDDNPEPEPEPDPEPDPEPLPDADETFQTIETEYPVEGGVGSLDRVMVNISDIPMLHEKVFTINYDSTCLELIDACAFTKAEELTTGMVAGTYIELLSVTDGQVKFRINKTFSDKVVTSGAINMMTFKNISSETAVVTSKVEKAQYIQ